jgi:dihydroxyacetone kinase
LQQYYTCTAPPEAMFMQNMRVVVDTGRDNAGSHVAVISGGGCGHEPAHAAYVGGGMLAAAVCGDVFASPSPDLIVAAIRSVTGAAGCLLVVTNYTGDCLNFGLAEEVAKAEGLLVEHTVVADDCGVPAMGIAGCRGIAGTVLVAKVRLCHARPSLFVCASVATVFFGSLLLDTISRSTVHRNTASAHSFQWPPFSWYMRCFDV